MPLIMMSSDSLCERIAVLEKLVKYIEEYGTGVEFWKRNRDPVEKMAEVECPRNSLERNEEVFDVRKKRKIVLEAEEVDLGRQNSLNDFEHVESSGVAQVGAQSIHPRACKTLAEIEAREQSLRREHESLAARERKVDEIIEALGARIRAVEDREKEFNCFIEGKTREIILKEEKLRLKLENEKRREQQKLKSIDEIVVRLKSAENKLEGMRENLGRRLEEIECRENVVWESAELSVREGDLICKSLEKQLEELEKRRSEFNSFQEEKMRELELKEQLLNEIREKAVKDAKLRNEELIMEGNLIKESIEKDFESFEKIKSEFNSFQEQKMRDLDSKEQLLDDREKAVKDAKLRNEELIREGELIRESMKKELEEFEKIKSDFNSFQEKKTKELDSKEELLKDSEKVNQKLIREGELVRESMKKELEEFEKIKSDFNSFQEKKMGEMYLKEQLLNAMSEKVVNNAKLRNDNLVTHERSIYQLLKRLKLAKDNVKDLKDEVDQRFRILVSKENDVNSTSDWLERRMDEADSMAKRLEVKKKNIKLMEDEAIRKKYELREKEKELELRERALQAWQEELKVKQKEVDSAQELNLRRLEKLDAREKSMSELAGKCFKEHQAKKKELLLVKDLVDNVARFLGVEDENLKDAVRELEIREKRIAGHVVEHELIHQHSSDKSNGHVRKELHESADLKFTVRMDGKNLQMFLNDPEKDLVSMGDEIFKVLHLSSDPAKLVLDAMVGFYPPHLRDGDTAFNVRKTCIALLKQLVRMTRVIKPCVREEAMQVALAWKSKMAENPSSLEALGFLLILKAYDVASSFNKAEISAVLMMVSLHREETPDLDCLLGFADTLAEKISNRPRNAYLDNAIPC